MRRSLTRKKRADSHAVGLTLQHCRSKKAEQPGGWRAHSAPSEVLLSGSILNTHTHSERERDGQERNPAVKNLVSFAPDP